MDLFLFSLTNKAFPFPIFFSSLPSLLRFLLFSSLLFSSSSVFASVNNSKTLSTQRQCTEDHFSALLRLKQGFYLPKYNTTTLSSWNPDNRDCCSWEGIICDAATGHVISLDLSYLGISGRVNLGGIFCLQSLQRLNLAGNDFDVSPFPSGFDKLTSLTHLNLSWLNLYGQIPLEISRLTTLVSLDLSFNYHYNGWGYEYLKLENTSIRELLQNLSSLRELHLDSVNISAQGSEWGLALSSALPLLRKLSLSGCRLSGPIHSSLSRLRFLSELDLSVNNLSSIIPNFIGNFSSLTSLSLSGCGLHGKIPESIFRLANLQTLDVGYNPLLTGEIPQNNTLRGLVLSKTGFCSKLRDSLGNLKLLTMLSLTDCNLSGPLPSWPMKLDKLVYLDLSSNGFSGPIPSSNGNKLQNLEVLLLYNNSLSGTIPSSLFSLPSLRVLLLRDNQLSGQLEEFQNASSSLLQRIDLSNNKLRGPIPRAIFQLTKLTHLMLSSNSFNGTIPSLYGNELQNCEYLLLSNNSLSGTIPSSFFSLPSLLVLDLLDNQFGGQLEEFQNASSSLLQRIDLSNNKLRGPIPRAIFQLTKLTYLILSSNSFNGSIPSLYGNELQNCEYLFLSNNSLNGTIPSSLFSLPSLRLMDLGDNQFSGQLEEFQNASSSLLQWIELSANKLQGPIPRSIFQLTNLTNLLLPANSFNGTIPSLYGNELQNCEYLDLSNNSLSGTIPSSLFSLPSLQYLFLLSNQFSGQIGEFHNASSLPLMLIYLDNNKLQGPIPRSIFELTKLTYLSLSSNNFSGDVDLGLFQNLTELSSLSLSDNSFSVRGTNSTFVSFPQFITLSLGSCNISKFPDILKNQEGMRHLDLSNNIINGEIPYWIWKVGNGSLSYLNLSHNALEGLEQSFPHLSVSLLEYLDLSFNKLKGSIPIPPWSITFYSLANNNFSGEVPSLICNCTSLKVLDLSDNCFNGWIPPCLGEISDVLIVLNLGGNEFHGSLHQAFKEGCTLETLDLNGNRLEGQVPRSLVKCKMLEVLNLRNNELHDTFPLWLEKLSQLRILILRSNKFHGTIGQPLINHTFPLLQIFDISSNSFTGSLPSNMFKSWKAMMDDGKSQSQFLITAFGNGYYQDKVIVVSKGQEMKLVKILLAFTAVDLSNNQFHGDIPQSVGDLKSLHVLNMSYNHLTGRIPSSLGNIKDLESLDLSQNNLSGEIPQQLTKLTFLAVLNLSQNHLMGSIPQSQQFLTFTNESFQGNLGLCGPPLSRKCGNTKVSLPSTELKVKYDWRTMWIGFGVGYGVGMGILFWTLALWTKGKREYIIFIDRMLLLIFPCEAFSLMHQH